MAEQNEKWQWQNPGEAWKNAGLYHITLTIPSREPLLGTLLIPDNDPGQAKVEYTVLGRLLVDALWEIPKHHPEIQVLHYCLMPDHLHSVWYVRRTMPRGIKSAVQGFWQGIKKIGRAYSFLFPTASRENRQEFQANRQESPINRQSDQNQNNPNCHSANLQASHSANFQVSQAGIAYSSISPTASRDDYQASLRALQQTVDSIRCQLGDDCYYALPPLFTEMPHIRPMGQRRQLPATIRYIDMNPQRLATKRLMPGFFRVQEGIEIAGRTYSGVGNIALLQSEHFATVHVRRFMVEDAERHGYDQPLRDYMNGCVMSARKGAVMVSPFISPKEKDVLAVLMAEGHGIIYLADNGFRDYYKPADGLFDAVAAGKMLILSPWAYDAGKRHISRTDCIALNAMAEEIAVHPSISPTASRENCQEYSEIGENCQEYLETDVNCQEYSGTDANRSEYEETITN